MRERARKRAGKTPPRPEQGCPPEYPRGGRRHWSARGAGQGRGDRGRLGEGGYASPLAFQQLGCPELVRRTARARTERGQPPRKRCGNRDKPGVGAFAFSRHLGQLAGLGEHPAVDVGGDVHRATSRTISCAAITSSRLPPRPGPRRTAGRAGLRAGTWPGANPTASTGRRPELAHDCGFARSA